MKYLKIYYRLLVYFTSLIFCSGDVKKKKALKMKKKTLKMNSQLVIFRAFFFFFVPPDPKSEKFP